MQENQQPGQVIIPHGSDTTPKPSADSPAPAVEAATQPAVSLPIVTPVSNSLPPTETPASQLPPGQSPVQTTATALPKSSSDIGVQSTPAVESEGWQFHAEEAAPEALAERPAPQEITWTAAEFVAHEKSLGWYVSLGLGGALSAAIIYLLTKDKITTGIIIFALVAFGVFASRKPRETQYRVDSHGIQVGTKSYNFHDYKTFSIVDEGTTASIVFMPLKRFMPPLSIYVTPDIEDTVVDVLSTYLPFAEHKSDALESLMRRIRF